MRHSAFALVILALLAGAGFAQGDEALLCPSAPTVEPPAALSASLMPENERLTHLQNVWQTIRVSHLYTLVPDHGSGDLTALRLEYEPLLRAADADWTEYAEAEDPYLRAALEYLIDQAAAGTPDPVEEPVVQAASGARLVLEPVDAQPGEELRVSFENAPGYEQDWITLVETSEAPTTFGEYFYLDGEKEGVLTFTAPSTPGSYEARFYQDWPDGGYVVVARSNPVTVVEQGGSAAAQATDQPVSTASCTPSLAGDVSFENAEEGYCLVHDSRWLVIDEGSAGVTLRIPPEGAPESMALSIGVVELGADDSLDDVVDAFLEDFFPQQQDFTDVEILERSDALVAGQPAKRVVFSGNLLDSEQVLDVVGRVYVVGGPDRKLYILTFILDTTRVPQKAYRPTVDSMVRSFTLTSLPGR